MIAGLGAGLALPQIAHGAGPEPLGVILARSGLVAETGAVLVDLGTGAVLEAHQPELPRPPASVAKVLTALWALETLGPAYRFRTRVRVSGPVEAGVVQGDLALVGSGDPLLDTDALGALVRALRAQDIRGITGQFLIGAGALPFVPRIAAGQPVDAGYNPAISGMNLNFNRVRLDLAAEGEPAFSAPGGRYTAAAPGFRLIAAEAGSALHGFDAGAEVWTLPAASLAGGGRWLPVRAPGRYAGAAFRDLAAQVGLVLPEAQVVRDATPGADVAVHTSPALEPLLRDMLFYSTNLTAEAVGLRASQTRGGQPRSLAASAAAMSDWLRARYGVEGFYLENHSGLAPDSRLSAAQMVRVLAGASALPPLQRERPVLYARRRAVALEGVRVVAKTGTLDYASGLAGYIEARGGRRLAFAIFAADPDARVASGEGRRDAAGPRAFAARARAQEQALLRRWTALHAGAGAVVLRPRPRGR